MWPRIKEQERQNACNIKTLHIFIFIQDDRNSRLKQYFSYFTQNTCLQMVPGEGPAWCHRSVGMITCPLQKEDEKGFPLSSVKIMLRLTQKSFVMNACRLRISAEGFMQNIILSIRNSALCSELNKHRIRCLY
jgi:hypothetical protein